MENPVAISQPPVWAFEESKIKLLALVNGWNQEQRVVEANRRLRYVEANVEVLQQQGFLEDDETIIPIRVIDTNIRREQPAYVAYLRQSRRLAVFRCVSDPQVNVEAIEADFTYGMTYPNWEIPHFKCLDGAQQNGRDFVEIEFDESKPLHVGVDHVGTENLIFPRDARNIQACEIIIRRYELTVAQLKSFVTKYGFDAEQVGLVLEPLEKDTQVMSNVTVYKAYRKIEGVVYVGWFCDKNANDWIKTPQKLFLGKKRQTTSLDPITGQEVTSLEEVNEYKYPIIQLLYCVSEQPTVVRQRGRVFLDETKQEAQTALWSSLVNGSVRASNVYGSPVNPSATGGKLGVVDLKLKHGQIYTEPVSFWGTPYPDPQLVAAAQSLDIQTQQETGQVNFAAQNRQDSRKTATEIGAATEQAALLSGVQVAMYSAHLREVWTAVWEIVQSQALQGLITFAQVTVEQQTPVGVQIAKQNNAELLSKEFDVRPAGDIDVIQRSEKMQKYAQFWPIVANTPLAATFMADMIKMAFPEDAERYEQVLLQIAGQNQQAAGLKEVVAAMAVDDNGIVKPEFKEFEPQLKQVLGGGQ